MDTSVFALILGLGIAIPFTCTILIVGIVKMQLKENYQIDMTALAKLYIASLSGWALFFSSIW